MIENHQKEIRFDKKPSFPADERERERETESESERERARERERYASP